MDWLSVCPADFVDELKQRLDMPPGVKELTEQYAKSFGNDLYDTDTVVREAKYLIDQDERDEAFKLRQAFRKEYAQQWGKYAEALVARYILEQGMPIRELDWRPGGSVKKDKKGVAKGEIDIISQRGNRIVFIEVKARCGHLNDPLKAIDDKKIRRLCKGADTYLKLQRETYEYQFDIALVTGDYFDYNLEYIEDAFLAPLRTTR